MKKFEQFLAESVKEYKFTLRFACKLDEHDVDRIERFLGKYDLRTMSSVSVTPISKNQLFFNDIQNIEVSKIDIVTGYPIAADILRQQLSDLIPMNITHILIHPEGWSPQEAVEVKEDKPALLDTPYDDKSDNGENYGREFVTKFLKSLSKRNTVEVINALSVKPPKDKAQEQMSTEEGSSKSVISGEKKK
jgi:hypothetical protein